MANEPTRITQLPALGAAPAASDLLAIVSGGDTKKVRVDELLGASMLRRASIDLTNDDIKALPTTPIDLVLSAPAGYRNKLLGASIYVDNGGGQYTNISAYSYLAIKESTGGWLTVGGPLNTFDLVAPESTLAQLSEFLGGSPGQRGFDFPIAVQAGYLYIASAFSEIVGGLVGIGSPSIQLTADNDGDGNFTGGHADNYGRIHVYYAVEQTL